MRPSDLPATAAAALREIARRLREAGVDTPELDARLLLMAATGLTREQLVLQPGQQIGDDHRARLGSFVLRRLEHEPVSRITGEREFYGRSFVVTQDTLDPRPDSETVISAALSLIDEEYCSLRTSPLSILDVGTGTGCLLLTLLAELPEATGTGIDISPAALAVARENAVRLGLVSRANWRRGDLLDGIGGGFDLVVANPPYIASREIETLPAEVRLYDPRLALDGGTDGLDAYRRIIAGADGLLARRGGGAWIVLEIGAGQDDAIATIITTGTWNPAEGIRRFQDLGGHTRCVAWKTHV